MRILFDARGVREQSDGMSNYIRHLLAHLLRVDTENEYVVLAAPGFADTMRQAPWPAGRNARVIVTRAPFMGLAQQAQIPWLTRRLPSAALYHYPHFDLPLLAHPRTVVTIYDLNHVTFGTYFDSHKRLKRTYSLGTTALSLRRARHILTISQTTKDQILTRFPWIDPQKVSVTYLGVNEAFAARPDPTRMAQFRAKYRLGEARYILYVGIDRTHKNLGRLLEAYRCLRRGGRVTQPLLLVGSLRRDGETVQQIQRFGLESSVRQLGYVTDDELPLAYRVADVFAFCSLSEGFGMPLLEAMASGVPIVTSNVGAMSEVAAGSAVLVNPWSVDSIADGLFHVLSSDGLRRRLIADGMETVRRFAWEETARKTLEIYRRVGQAGLSAPHDQPAREFASSAVGV